jgi:hypothetical protein
MNKNTGEREVNTTNMGWTTMVDLENKLVIHVGMNVTKLIIDPVEVDPDNIPLVWVEGKPVTRVRRMTEEEYIKYAKQFGLKFEVDMRIWHNTDKDVKKIKEETKK